MVSDYLFTRRIERIREHTREKYCTPRLEVEREIQARLVAKEAEKADAGDATGSVAGAEPEPLEAPEPETQTPEPTAQQEPEEQTPKPLPASMDTMNVLSAHLRAKEIDPDTTILAALGEHYVMTLNNGCGCLPGKPTPRQQRILKRFVNKASFFIKTERAGEAPWLQAIGFSS